MHFSELALFRRTSHETVPIEILRALRLPMPQDVFEQFIVDHGVNEFFQQQYGHIDLHAVRWELLELPASEIGVCTVSDPFEVSDRVFMMAKTIPDRGWADVDLAPEAAEFWQTERTWMRPPVMIRKSLFYTIRPLQLVEGLHRMGMLQGLIASGFIEKSSLHKVWIGEKCPAPENEGPWRDVLRRDHMSFRDWLINQREDEEEIGEVTMRLVGLKDRSRYSGRDSQGDLESVLEDSEKDETLRSLRPIILEAYDKWRSVMGL